MKKISRREFIAKSSLGLYALTGLPTAFYPRGIIPNLNYADCLVLGAGMAGVTAAFNLAKKYNVILLEGSSRIGGRIYTNRTLTDLPVELGAEYIHMPPKSSTLWQEIEAFKIKTTLVKKMSGGRMYHEKWGKLKSLTGSALSWNLWDAMWLFHNIEKSTDKDISAGEWIRSQGYDQVGNDIAQTAFNGHLPANLDNLSVRGYLSDKIPAQLNESYDYHIPAGYDTILTSMTQNLDVRLNQFIESISYDTNGVKVITRQGKEYRAKSAVLAFSANMIKSGEIEFKPGLPQEKLEALKMIEQGHHSKVVIEFSSQFWPKEAAMLHRIDQKRRVGRTYFNVFYNEPTQTSVLTALIAGPDAEKIKNLSDEEVLKNICLDLDEVFPSAGSTYNKIKRRHDGSLKYYRQQWIDDPFAKGGISYLNMNKSSLIDVTQARSILASAEKTRPLFWAGEATATQTQPSSVHGAYSTGLRAAYEVLQHLG